LSNKTAFKALRGYHENIRIQTETNSQRFQSSLDMTLWLGQWSLSQFASYIDFLDKEIKDKFKDPAKDRRLAQLIPTDPEKRIRAEQLRLELLNTLLERVNECAISLEGNIRVFRGLSEFYQNELLAETKTLGSSDPFWLQNECCRIRDFEQQLKIIRTVTENLARRANLLLEAGKRLEDLLHRMLHVRNESFVKEMSVATQNDSADMKKYATVTFVLLPMTVVSTFFATDVVKFQDVDTLSGKWSSGAAAWFIGFMFALMILVYLTYSFGESSLKFIVQVKKCLVMVLSDGFVKIIEWLGDLPRRSHEPTPPPAKPPSDPGSNLPPNKESPVPNSDERETPSPSTPDGDLNGNDLMAQGSQSGDSMDSGMASPRELTPPLLMRRSSPDLEKGIV